MNRNPGSTGSCSRPELTRRFDNQCKFPALVVFGDRIAGNGAGKTALRADGKSIAAYGASAKGATLLNYCGVDHTMLDFVVDRSATKQGFAMPGVGLPIFTPDELLRRQPDYVLLLAWNFLDEILEQQAEYRRRGGQFIVPVPEPRII